MKNAIKAVMREFYDDDIPADFIVQDNITLKRHLVQVAWSLSDEPTCQREMKALRERHSLMLSLGMLLPRCANMLR